MGKYYNFKIHFFDGVEEIGYATLQSLLVFLKRHKEADFSEFLLNLFDNELVSVLFPPKLLR